MLPPGVSFEERPNFTPEQVKVTIENALGLVEALEPPEDLRAAVFTQACAMLSNKQIIQLQHAPIGMPAMAIPGNARH